MDDVVTEPDPVPPPQGSVSVCIPVRDGAATLERALRSVEAQTRPALEVVAVDDGSTDGTPRLLERLRDEGRIAAAPRLEGAGVSAARNLAVRHARGRWIAPLDADDELDPTALERGLAALAATPGAGWCISGIVRVDAAGEQRFESAPPPGPVSGWLPALLEGCFVERTLLLERATLSRLGGYDPAFRCYEDWELCLRLVRAGVTAAHAPGPLYRYIKTPGSLTSDLGRLLAAYAQLYERHHRPLADTGDPRYRRIYARRLWALAREHLDHGRDAGAALRCALASLRYDFAPGRLLRAARRRTLGT
jgi:glycosyltransferase involved in cell wall biosynthesis